MAQDSDALTGRCYCGEVRYRITGDIQMRAFCYCRECQYIAGGGPNVAAMIADDAFSYTQGAPRSFARPDLDTPARREFCGTCGTHLVTRSPRAPGLVIVKVGSLDEPSRYGMPSIAVHTAERQAYHCIPEGVAQFEKTPPRA